MERYPPLNASIVFSTSEFEKPLVEAVDESFLSLLGESVRKAIYVYWEKEFSLSRAEIPLRVNDVAIALDRTFGSSSGTVARCIARKLYSKLGLDFQEESNCGFAGYVTEARVRR